MQLKSIKFDLYSPKSHPECLDRLYNLYSMKTSVLRLLIRVRENSLKKPFSRENGVRNLRKTPEEVSFSQGSPCADQQKTEHTKSHQFWYMW